MNKMGFKTSLQEVAHSLENVSKRQFNVMGILGDSLGRRNQKGLLLNTHIDTVGPGIRSYWTETGGDPFQATIKEDKDFWPGTVDRETGFSVQAQGVRTLHRSQIEDAGLSGGNRSRRNRNVGREVSN